MENISMDNEMLNKRIRKAVIQAELKMKEREYTRLQNQINELEQAKKTISLEVQQMMGENQVISEWLDNQNHEALCKHETEKPNIPA